MPELAKRAKSYLSCTDGLALIIEKLHFKKYWKYENQYNQTFGYFLRMLRKIENKEFS